MTTLPTLGWQERRRVVTPLGLRFWDPALDRQVTDGLDVLAIPEHGGAPWLAAYRTHSGVYAFRGLPGLRAFEYPSEDDSIASPFLPRRFLIRVTDLSGRFLPALLGISAPFSGVCPTGLAAGSPALGAPGLFLFSAPTREVPAGLAVIRAQLVDASRGGNPRPAAYAVLEIHHGGNLLQIGIADAQGSVAVCLPYPTFVDPYLAGAGSPPLAAARQSWWLGIRVRFEPEALQRPAGQVPELRSIFAQAQVHFLVPDGAGVDQPVAELTADLVFGQELVLRTGADARLFLGPPATSP